MWRKLFKVFGFRVCAVEDSSRMVLYRFMHMTPFGELYCNGYVIGQWAYLNKDGTCSDCFYMIRWKEV